VNSKRIGYIALVVIGIVCAFLNAWVFLLEREGRSLLFALMGIFIVIAGIVNLRRQT
jgi:hypothetical protein